MVFPESGQDLGGFAQALPLAKKAEVLGQIKGLCEELGHLAKEL